MGNVAAVERALEEHPNVAMVFLESPENPTLRIADIEAISRLTEPRGVLLVVDNTFCSPYLQQPFRLGADLVMHSLTKFVNGHSTSVGGALLGPFRFMKTDFFPWYKDVGATPSPFDSWLNGMTVQSLAPREAQESETALAIARFLSTHPKVAVRRLPRPPRLPAGRPRPAADAHRRGDPHVRGEGGRRRGRDGHELLRPEGHADGARRLASAPASRYIQHPASMTHAVVPEADRLARGITPGLIRLSVGLEGGGRPDRAPGPGARPDLTATAARRRRREGTTRWPDSGTSRSTPAAATPPA